MMMVGGHTPLLLSTILRCNVAALTFGVSRACREVSWRCWLFQWVAKGKRERWWRGEAVSGGVASRGMTKTIQ